MRWNAHPPNERGAPRDMVGAAVGRSGFATKLITMYCHETRIRQLLLPCYAVPQISPK